MSKFLAIGVVAAASLSFEQVQAADITFEFEGVVDSMDASCPSDEITIGEFFSGSYTFNSTAPDTYDNEAFPETNPWHGTYDSVGVQYGMRVNLSIGSFSTREGLTIQTIRSFPPGPDESAYIVTGGVVGGRHVAIFLHTRDRMRGLPNDSLPLVPPPLSQFEVNAFSLEIVRNGIPCQVRGYLTSLTARPQGNGLYDNFSSTLIDPALWKNSPSCQQSENTLECVRELRGNKLQMRIRTYGASDSDQGDSNDFVALAFRHPERITTIVSNVIVTEAGAVGCPFGSHTHARIDGTFFNTGSGEQADDVTAFIVVEQFSTRPPGELVVGVFAHTAGEFFGHTDLGTIAVGEKVQLTIRWHHEANRFVFRLERENMPASVATIPYTFSDTFGPVISNKKIGVHNFAASCTNGASIASMQANFLNVRVNQGALP